MAAIAVSRNTTYIEGGGSMDLREECQKVIDAGIPIRFLARKIDYDNSTLSKWLRGERNISQKGLKGIGGRLLPQGTVLFSSRAPIGYVAIAENELCTNQGFKSVIPNLEKATSEFLYYTLGFYNRRQLIFIT